MSSLNDLLSSFENLTESEKNEFINLTQKPTEPNLNDTVLSYQNLSHTNQKLFFKRILTDIFKHKWDKHFSEPGNILHEDFHEEFNIHFHDPFSQALISMANKTSKHINKRSQLFRIGLIYLDKAWRLHNTHTETLGYDTMRCIMAKSNKATSLLTGKTTVANMIEKFKSEKLPSPDPELAIVRSIDNYKQFEPEHQQVTQTDFLFWYLKHFFSFDRLIRLQLVDQRRAK